jgi:cytochrome c553
MVYMSRHLSDEYLREIATFYSKLAPPFPTPIQPAATKEALARGEQIVRNGDQAKGIPACVACHGKALTGMLPGVPGSSGCIPITSMDRWAPGAAVCGRRPTRIAWRASRNA